ncbi:MAG: TMEM165/GDT1 family protein [Burkholderiaceae bacterium]|nr:TMEM165/GDT1 family protein [Burkholderiaceae bacterium]
MDFYGLLISTGVVALAEIGDKTQLLSLMLAARYPKHAWPIVWGILLATLANHALAAYVGHWVAGLLNPDLLRWILGIGFLVLGVWLLIPDKLDEDQASKPAKGAWAIFALTTSLFFIAEMGDKTQIATIALGAKYDSVLSVTLGTTMGMMLANAPAVWLGQQFTKRLPIVWVHRIAATIFILLGMATLLWGGNLT